MKKIYQLLFFIIGISASIKSFSLPVLSSLPTSNFTIFLDFDGHYVPAATVWNGGNAINCAPSGMTDAQITDAFNRVAEDFRPFNLNVTTDSTKFLSSPLIQRIRIIVTPTNYFYAGVGGIAYTGSFTYGDNTPGFVFVNMLPVGGPISPKTVGECCSHEAGHSLGLSHQSRYGADCYTPIEYYHTGNGTGETSWAPIMGNSYSRNMTGWNFGATNFECVDIQDNLDIIVTSNGFTYRVDDYTETLNASTNTINPSNINKSGIISTTTDKDAFKITLTQNSNMHIVATPYNIGVNDEGANLDIKLTLYNNTGALISTFDPASIMSVTMDTILNTGTYYIVIDGAGNANVNDYGSLGSYTITGVAGALPIRSASLSGTTINNKHNLSWNIIADEAIKEIVIEASSNGTSFSSLQSVNGIATKYTYQPFNNSGMYYRLKVTSAINQTVYSNVISLKSNGYNGKMFEVSSFVNNDLIINAGENFQYRISDANGRVITTANGNKGINKIAISNQPNGLYTIQLISNNVIQSERIIKQ